MYHNDTDEKLQQLCATNDELSALLKEYEEENKFLLSQITHEIRNPLTLMYSTLQLIEHKNPNVSQLTYWSNLKDDMKDVFSLLDRLSEYNHCDKLSIAPVNLEAMIKDLSVSFEPYMHSKKARITVSLDHAAQEYARSYPCDKTKMKQVFTNLLKNAIEAVDKNGEITVGTSLDTDESNLLINVTNTGSVITEDELSTLFTPFITSKSSGTGLGLPTAKRIVLSHNGSLDVTSRNNKTTFLIRLPIGHV